MRGIHVVWCHVASVTSHRRAPFSTGALWVATLVGGLFAAAWLVRRNRLCAVVPTSAIRQDVPLWLGGIVALFISLNCPPDLLSQLLSAGLFSFVVLGVWLLATKDSIPVAAPGTGVKGSIWVALATALVVAFAIRGATSSIESISSTATSSFHNWQAQHDSGAGRGT